MIDYYVKICGCGRVHFIEEKMLIKSFKNSGSIVHICNNCGWAEIMWGCNFKSNKTKEIHGCTNNNIVEMNGMIDKTISVSGYKIKNIIASYGEEVPMCSGRSANYYGNPTFEGYRFIDIPEGRQLDVLEGHLKESSRTVNTRFLIESIDDEDKLRALRLIRNNIDWSFTEYEKISDL